MLQDHYSVLGVPRAASELAIKKAYRRLVLRYHPDRNPGSKTAESAFRKVVAAYETLSQPDKRAEYDSLLDAGRRARDEQVAESIRRQEARRAHRRAEARRPSRRRAQTVYRANELDRRDLRNGIILGSALAAWFGCVLAPDSADVARGVLAGWSLLPLPAGILGWRLGVRLEAPADRLAISWRAAGPFAHLLVPWVPSLCVAGFACGSLLAARQLFGAPIATDGIVGAAVAAGIAATVGSGFGRAFTSVASRAASRLVGLGVGALIGAVCGGLLGLFFAASQIEKLMDLGMYDTLLSSALAGSLGGALASAIGSRRAI